MLEILDLFYFIAYITNVWMPRNTELKLEMGDDTKPMGWKQAAC